MSQVCKNCGCSGDGKFCSNCGQKYNVPRFTFRHIIEEAIHAFTHADKSIVGYIKKLCTDPGDLAHQYIVERKRKQYFNPFTFFLLITALSAFIESSELHIKESLFHPNSEYGHLFNVYSKALSLAAIPIIALALWLIHFKRPRLLYTEYVVFAVILLSLFSVLEATANLLNYLIAWLAHKQVSVQNNLFYLFMLIAYFTLADYRFHRRTSNYHLLQSVSASVTATATILAIPVFIVFAFINDFQGIGSLYFYGIHLGH